MTPVKYPQHILAFNSEVVERYFPNYYNCAQTVRHLEGSSYFDLMNDGEIAVIARRQELETDEGYLQALPYTVIRIDAPHESKYFVYERASKGSGESRLAGLASIGIGGHVELCDLDHDNGVINLEDTLSNCAEREKEEEVIIFDNYDKDDVTQDSNVVFTGAFLIDNSTPVGRVHIGIVGLVAIEVEDYNEITIKCLENGVESIGLYTAEELLSMVDNAPEAFEPWSKALIYAMRSDDTNTLSPLYIPEHWTMTMDGNNLEPEPLDRSLD